MLSGPDGVPRHVLVPFLKREPDGGMGQPAVRPTHDGFNSKTAGSLLTIQRPQESQKGNSSLPLQNSFGHCPYEWALFQSQAHLVTELYIILCPCGNLTAAKLGMVKFREILKHQICNTGDTKDLEYDTHGDQFRIICSYSKLARNVC